MALGGEVAPHQPLHGVDHVVGVEGLDAELAVAQLVAATRPVVGFSLSMPLSWKADVAGILPEIELGEVRGLLRSALADTDLLQQYFRITATRALLIQRYESYEKSTSAQQGSSGVLPRARRRSGRFRRRQGDPVTLSTSDVVVQEFHRQETGKMGSGGRRGPNRRRP